MNDKLDSALFSRNDHTIDQLQKNYAYAMAVINESLVFNPEPFTMSAPQLIDGFIVSENITVESVETKNLDFVSSDHNPVVMKFALE